MSKVKGSQLIDKQDLIKSMNKAISLLEINYDEAVKLLFPFVPCNGSVSLDFGIYTLQQALIFGEQIQQSLSKKDEICLPTEINNLFDKCKENNSEFTKLMEWSLGEIKYVHDQMKRAHLSIKIEDSFHSTVEEMALSNPQKAGDLFLSLQIDNPQYHLLANSYKDSFEIDFYLNLLGNLLTISKNGLFSKNPFDEKKINGNSLTDRNHNLIKGNVINWIIENSNEKLGKIIKYSYDNKLRNLLGGHNDYIYDLKKETFYSKDKKINYPYSRLSTTRSNLDMLQNALRLEILTRKFYEMTEPGKMADIGYMNWSFNKDASEVLISQYWSNFNQREIGDSPKIISFYKAPLKLKGEEKRICLGFNKKYFFPEDLRVIANNESLKIMELLSGRDNLKIKIISIAPNVQPFTNMSKAKITVFEKNFLVIDELNTEVDIDKPALLTLIDYLKN